MKPLANEAVERFQKGGQTRAVMKLKRKIRGLAVDPANADKIQKPIDGRDEISSIRSGHATQ
jgi:hypothetical protein